MSPAAAAHKALNSEVLRTLSGCLGPCVTVTLPPSHAGSQTAHRRVHVHNALRTLRETLPGKFEIGADMHHDVHVSIIPE